MMNSIQPILVHNGAGCVRINRIGFLRETVLKTNLEAAYEIARQLKLRNIGGVIVVIISYFLFGNESKSSLQQNHFGDGDNIAGDKN